MERNILILGAGKSSIALIDYLIEHAKTENWQVTVADITHTLAEQKAKGRPHTIALGFNLNNDDERRALIAKADIVISMLPAALHLTVAHDCLVLKKNLVTPSYISDDMKALAPEVEAAGLLFMNEMGLDPGIDHMSAMQLIDGLKAKGATITGFKSHCGGLVAPQSDTNLWHYKFTWNPRNVILAGQGDGGIHYLMNGEKVNLKYEELFGRATQLQVEGYGEFESYPNRDSLKYISEYGLDGIATMYRGTLRVPPFCFGWDMLVQMGLTAEKEIPVAYLIQKVVANMPMDEVRISLLESTGVLDALNALTEETVSPAKLLQSLLEQRWMMQPGDKDMIVMVHQVEYKKLWMKKKLQSSLVYIGANEEHTAMATTVGLPVAIVTKMILNGEVKRKGVLMPKYADIYNPILKALEHYGVKFNEKEI